MITLYYKVLFMSRQNQIETLQEISDIKRIMERSSRFISLSGLSGIAAGLCALAGAYFANTVLNDYYFDYNRGSGYSDKNFESLKIKLLVLAAIVLAVALILSFILPGEEQNKTIYHLGSHCKKINVEYFDPFDLRWAFYTCHVTV